MLLCSGTAGRGGGHGVPASNDDEAGAATASAGAAEELAATLLAAGASAVHIESFGGIQGEIIRAGGLADGAARALCLWIAAICGS